MTRDEKIAKLAKHRTDDMEIDELIDYFYDHQKEDLEDLSNQELDELLAGLE